MISKKSQIQVDSQQQNYIYSAFKPTSIEYKFDKNMHGH